MEIDSAYHDTIQYIYHFTDYEKRGFAAYAAENYSLDRVRTLLSRLGNPQYTYRTIHIAGTKGKGSTSAMLESILRHSGLRTGLYTSPHLHTFRERIQANGRYISRQDIVRLTDRMKPLVDDIPELTTFEFMTSLALKWYAEEKAQWVVLEVGLGGRLDATNVVEPAVSIITSISYDHMAILGETLTDIATEKAGIIKKGTPVVSAPQSDEARHVIEATCQANQAPLIQVGRDWTWTPGPFDLDGQFFSIRDSRISMDSLWIPLLGEYQIVNATTAVAALKVLEPGTLDLPESGLREGLCRVEWPARFEILNREPLLVVDSAHNADSGQKLVAALETYLDFEKLYLVFGASPDHASPELLEVLLSRADRAFVTQSHHARAADPGWLFARASELGFQVYPHATVPQALDNALAEAQSKDLICCTGSVFVAAEARAAWFARQGATVPMSDPGQV